MILQQKTKKPVQFEITEQTRDSLSKWIAFRGLAPNDYLFSSRIHCSDHISTRQYARIVHKWIDTFCVAWSCFCCKQHTFLTLT